MARMTDVMIKFVVVGNSALAAQLETQGYEAVLVPQNASFGLAMDRVAYLGDPNQVFLVCNFRREDLAQTAMPYVRGVIVIGGNSADTGNGLLRVASGDAGSVLAIADPSGAGAAASNVGGPPPPGEDFGDSEPADPYAQPTDPYTQPDSGAVYDMYGESDEISNFMNENDQTSFYAESDIREDVPSSPSTYLPGPDGYAQEDLYQPYPSPSPDGYTQGQPPPGPGQQPLPDGQQGYEQPGYGQYQQGDPYGDPYADPYADPYGAPDPNNPYSKAMYDDTTYDPAFKSAPWANQNTSNTPQGLIICVSAAKGGAGKSTLTCWLSEALSASGVSVALVDANIGQPDIAKMTGTWGQSPGVAALTGQQRFTDKELFDASLTVEGLGLVLGGPAKPVDEAPEEMLAALTLATERLAAHYEFVIVDTPVGTVYEPVISRYAVHVADLFLIVTNPHQPTVHDTVLWVDDISKSLEDGGFDWPPEKMVGVLNRADPKTDLDLKTIRSWAPNLNILCDVPEVKGVIAAVNSGEWRCPTVARESVANLAQQLCRVHPSISDPIAQVKQGMSSPSKTSSSKGKRKGLLSRLRKR